MTDFKITTDLTPKGDQPQAIRELSAGLRDGASHQVLIGVTGSGKTFTMANVIAEVNRPTLVIAHNKTLAAQLYNEFRRLFPENAVEYFVSYYDYYQPEAYLPTTDTYIQKDSSINEMIDKMRHSATRSVLSRKDVIIVASVSCIYGLGAPEDYLALRVELEVNGEIPRDRLLADLVAIQYERNDVDFHRGVFRVRGDRVDIFPAYEEDLALRIEFFGDVIENIAEIDPLRGVVIRRLPRTTVFPASHYVTLRETRKKAIRAIREEVKQRIAHFRKENKLIEAQRIEERTLYDMEMIHEIGYCSGIENYSRHLTGRAQGEPPPTLMDYFPDDFLVFIDESHMSIPQLNAMYHGDYSRKSTLVEYGFRLPSALDNRPLTFDEFNRRIRQVIYVSATPAEYEFDMANGRVAEQIVRPTGLLDPAIEVRSAEHQVDDLLEEIRKRVERNERVLVTTLTKRMAEDLAEYYADLGLQVRYLHSDVKTVERMEIIRELRTGDFDVLIGINLLREGLDIPEVSLVAILDADKEGFLRSERALIQTFGRAARHVSGSVILYADRITPSMRKAMDETDRRRKIQHEYNERNGITPASIRKEITPVFFIYDDNRADDERKVAEIVEAYGKSENIEELILELKNEMRRAADDLEFEKAARLRDRIRSFEKVLMMDFD